MHQLVDLHGRELEWRDIDTYTEASASARTLNRSLFCAAPGTNAGPSFSKAARFPDGSRGRFAGQSKVYDTESGTVGKRLLEDKKAVSICHVCEQLSYREVLEHRCEHGKEWMYLEVEQLYVLTGRVGNDGRFASERVGWRRWLMEVSVHTVEGDCTPIVWIARPN